MLKLIQLEFFKLRRKKMIWFMLIAAWVMPCLSFFYFTYAKGQNEDPALFYRWADFSLSIVFIMPIVLGIFSTILVYNETQYDILKQIWIVPVSKLSYFFCKFFMLFFYSVCFMGLEFFATIFFSNITGIVPVEWASIFYLLKKCTEIGILMPFVMIPILAIAIAQKGYIMSILITVLYSLVCFMTMAINEYLIPLSCLFVILDRNLDVPGVYFSHSINVLFAFLIIFIWDVVAIIFACTKLATRK